MSIESKSIPLDPVAAVTEERSSVYGPPWQNMPLALRIVRAIESGVHGPPRTGNQTYDDCLAYCIWMFATKLSRLSESPSHRDSILDLGGYAKCLLECRDRFFPEDEHAGGSSSPAPQPGAADGASDVGTKSDATPSVENLGRVAEQRRGDDAPNIVRTNAP